MASEELFAFAIGRRWNEDDPRNISTYMLGNVDVQVGTRAEAEDVLNAVIHREPSKRWRIYKLVEIPE